MEITLRSQKIYNNSEYVKFNTPSKKNYNMTTSSLI